MKKRGRGEGGRVEGREGRGERERESSGKWKKERYAIISTSFS